MPQTNRIAVLTVPTPVSWSIINAVVERFGPVHVIAEEREPRLQLIRKRMKRQGVLPVLGQAGFSLLEKLMARRSRRRIAEIVRDAGLDVAPNPACEIYKVDSVNSMACRAALAMIRPDVVLVIGTRIIGRENRASENREPLARGVLKHDVFEIAPILPSTRALGGDRADTVHPRP